MRSFDGCSPKVFALQKRHLITVVSVWMCDRMRSKLWDIIVLRLLFLLKQKYFQCVVCVNVEDAQGSFWARGHSRNVNCENVISKHNSVCNILNTAVY